MAVQLDTTPYWTESASVPRFPQLDGNLKVDVVVIGGGITGLTAAYFLAAEGRTVAVLERGRLGEVDTGHTTAHLTMVTDAPITDLASRFGRDHARAAWDAGLAAISAIDSIVRTEEIACGFAWVPAYLHPPPEFGDTDLKALVEQADLAGELGFDASYLDIVPLFRRPGIRFENQARFHPRKYLAGLARAITDKGGRIFEHTDAGEFSDNPRHVKANGASVTFDRVVLATHNPLVGRANVSSAALLQTKLALYTSYAITARVPKDIVADALWWDTADPYNYLRVEPHRDDDLVIFGGEDHKTGQAENTNACFGRLERSLLQVIPVAKVTHRWSGQVIETSDGLPYIGETADRQFAATGFSGNGMTFGTLAGIMATDYVLGRKNPWTDLFNPHRKTLRAAWNYLVENKDYPYYMFRGRFAGAAEQQLRSIPRGRGKVIEYKGQQVAAYRDESGTVVLRSAICTHMGCLVDWNDAERTWDCPCHGSRFEPDGSVIAGPGEQPLGEIS